MELCVGWFMLDTAYVHMHACMQQSSPPEQGQVERQRQPEAGDGVERLPQHTQVTHRWGGALREVLRGARGGHERGWVGNNGGVSKGWAGAGGGRGGDDCSDGGAGGRKAGEGGGQEERSEWRVHPFVRVDGAGCGWGNPPTHPFPNHVSGKCCWLPRKDLSCLGLVKRSSSG